MTKATTSSKSPSPKTSNPVLLGLLYGLGAGLLVCLAAWLSPLASADRPVLALFAVTLSLPLGAAMARKTDTPRAAGGLGLSAVIAALALAATVSPLEPALFVRTASWCVAAALIGVAIGGIGRGAGVVATCAWLFLNGLPFFYERLPMFESTMEVWALQGCPWLGFSADAFGGDPLRRPVLYLGQWTELSGSTGMGTLEASTLWLGAVPAFASLLLASVNHHSDSEPTAQAGTAPKTPSNQPA